MIIGFILIVCIANRQQNYIVYAEEVVGLFGYYSSFINSYERSMIIPQLSYYKHK